MKSIVFILLAVLFLLGCQKEFRSAGNDYIETAKKGLRDSLTGQEFFALDFTNAARSRVDSIGLFLLRVPFKVTKAKEEFVLIRTNECGVIQQGRIIHLKGEVSKTADGRPPYRSWNGDLVITTLSSKVLLRSSVKEGFITALHPSVTNRIALQAPQGSVMPEVIITYVIPSGSDLSWSTWFSVQSFFSDSYGSGGESGGGYYMGFSGGEFSGDSGGGGYASSSDGGVTGNTVLSDPVMLVDAELQDLRPEIDIHKYVACFDRVPDAGASCSIEIAADIPVDDNPNAFFNFSTGSPGHAFITITKKNGAQQVSQNIGFYPKSGYKALTYAPTAGKLVDNAKHEFNASIKMDLTPAQLSSVLIRMQQLSNINYDVDSYNCADWALDIFNTVRTDKLKIPLYGIPDSPMTQGSQTPQGLYRKLQQMMASNHPEKGNITIGIIKGYAGGSTGPCN